MWGGKPRFATEAALRRLAAGGETMAATVRPLRHFCASSPYAYGNA